MMLSDVCHLSVARHRKTKIGTEVAHITYDSWTPWSPCHFTDRSINASGSCSGECAKVLSVGTYCYVAICRYGGWLGEALRRPQREEWGGGHIVAASHLQLVTNASHILLFVLHCYINQSKITKLPLYNNHTNTVALV